MTGSSVAVIGAGVAGLWQALAFARRGHRVELFERTGVDAISSASASWFAGGMLAPYCEEEASESIVRELGLRSLALWKESYSGVVANGSIVVAQARDRGELDRFSRMTRGHTQLSSQQLAELEPDLGGRFARALSFPEEAHLEPRVALDWLADALQQAGGRVTRGVTVVSAAGLRNGGLVEGVGTPSFDWVIDCRGMGAAGELPSLRGVRGEMLIVRAPDVTLARAVRVLHPRVPVYVVPWSEQRFMIGATVIERGDDGPVTVRSALELLGALYALHPAFGEAEILEMEAGVRPAFADNVPKVVVRGRTLYVNGMYRHGYLAAPALAEIAVNYVETGAGHAGVLIANEQHSDRQRAAG